MRPIYRSMKMIALLSFFFFQFPAVAGELLSLKSSSQKQNLVELFSSEGCSSCPPAEAFVSSMRTDAGLWKKFIPIEFHVNYWDDLGWKDPYASQEFTDRQKNYATLWGTETTYTPGMVANGLEWTNWRKEGLSHINKYGPEVGVLEVKEQSKSNFVATFSPIKKTGKKGLFLNAALLGRDLTSQVARGENSGRKLKHDFLAITLKRVALGLSGSTKIEFTDKDKKIKADTYSVVFWVTDQKQNVVQTVGGDLSR